MPENTDEYVLAITATSKEKEAEKIVKIAIKKKLAACVNVIPQVKSFFWLKDEIKKGWEFLIIFRTKANLVEELKHVVLINQSYETAEFIVLPIISGGGRHLDWIDKVVKKP